MLAWSKNPALKATGFVLVLVSVAMFLALMLPILLAPGKVVTSLRNGGFEPALPAASAGNATYIEVVPENVSSVDAPLDVYWADYFALEFRYVNQTNNASLDGTIICNYPIFNQSYDGTYHRIIIGTMDMGGPGRYHVDVTIYDTYYNDSSTVFYLRIMERPITVATNISSFVNVTWGDTFNFSLDYNDTLTGFPRAYQNYTSSVPPSAISYDNATSEYIFQVNSTSFGEVGQYEFRLQLFKENYTSASVVFDVLVSEVPASITTNEPPVINATWGDLVNYSFDYVDARNNSSLSNATVVPGFPTEGIAYNGSGYTFTINTSQLGVPSLYRCYFTALLDNHEMAYGEFYLDIAPANSTLVTAPGVNGTIDVTWGDNVTLIHQFLDEATGAPIQGASVHVSATAGSPGWYFNGTHHVITINSTTLGPVGVYPLLITTSEINHVTLYYQANINVIPVPVTLGLLNSSTIDVNWGEQFSVVVSLNRTGDGMPVDGATLYTSIGGTLVSLGNGLYSMTMNASDLGVPGVYPLMVTAKKLNHLTVATQVLVNVAPVPCTLDVTVAPDASPIIGDVISFDVAFLTQGSNASIPDATVDVTFYNESTSQVLTLRLPYNSTAGVYQFVLRLDLISFSPLLTHFVFQAFKQNYSTTINDFVIDIQPITLQVDQVMAAGDPDLRTISADAGEQLSVAIQLVDVTGATPASIDQETISWVDVFLKSSDLGPVPIVHAMKKESNGVYSTLIDVPDDVTSGTELHFEIQVVISALHVRDFILDRDQVFTIKIDKGASETGNAIPGYPLPFIVVTLLAAAGIAAWRSMERARTG